MKNIWTDTKKWKGLARRGQLVYAKIKNKFEPKENGKFLAIEPDSGDVYLDADSVQATLKARKEHPDKLVYLKRIGYVAAGTMGSTILSRPKHA